MRPYVSLSAALTGALCVCWLVHCGCGRDTKDPAKLGSQHDHLFASADPESKACWDTATGAMKTNGYAISIQAIRTLLQQGKLNAEQTKAAQETATAVSDKMYNAANKGDANALQAIEDLRKASAR